MKKLLSASMSETNRTHIRRSAGTCAAVALMLLQGCASGYVIDRPVTRVVTPVVYQPVVVNRPVVQPALVQPAVVAVQPVAVQPAPAVVQPAVVVSQPAVAAYTIQQLDQITGPIALYPDPLIAQILHASTYPLDIVRAARLQRSGVINEVIDQQDMDPSVKAVAHYPTVLAYMDSNLEWTQQLGQAFMAQPNDVMQSIQRLRQQAASLGNLVTTAQQQVVYEEQFIRVIPVATEVIYVPVYQPQVVYYQRCGYTPFVSFSIGCSLGTWLDLDCDWNRHCVYRQGWSWNHWHDNVFIEHHHITRFHRPAFHDGDRSFTWQHDFNRDNRGDSHRGSSDHRGGPSFENQPPHNRAGGGRRADAGRPDIERPIGRREEDIDGSEINVKPSAPLNPAAVQRPYVPTARPPTADQNRPISPAAPPVATPVRPGGSVTPAPLAPTPQRPDAPVPSRPSGAGTPVRPTTPSAPPAASPVRPGGAGSPSPSTPVPTRPDAPVPSRPGGAGAPSPAPSVTPPAPRPIAPQSPAPTAPAPRPVTPPAAAPSPAPRPQSPAPVSPAPRPSAPSQPAAAPPRPSPAPTPAPKSPAQPDGPRRPR